MRRSCRTPCAAALLGCALSTLAPRAFAQTPQLPAPHPALRAQRESEPDERPAYGYWSVGRPRWFVAARPEVGTPYAKPYVSVGYGLPHWIWAGLDLNAIITPEMTQVYAGVRAATPILDLAFGVRDTWSFDKAFLRPVPRFTRQDVIVPSGQRARYWALEAEALGIIPLPHAGLVGNLIVVHTLDVPRGVYVYDESYRAVVADSLFLAVRVAAVGRFLPEDSLRAGALVEHVFETGRVKGVWRVGPIVSLQLTDHVEAMAGVTLAVSSPDSVGLALGTYGIFGVRYRWASGEPRPRAPWEGHFIPW